MIFVEGGFEMWTGLPQREASMVVVTPETSKATLRIRLSASSHTSYVIDFGNPGVTC